MYHVHNKKVWAHYNRQKHVMCQECCSAMLYLNNIVGKYEQYGQKHCIGMLLST